MPRELSTHRGGSPCRRPRTTRLVAAVLYGCCCLASNVVVVVVVVHGFQHFERPIRTHSHPHTYTGTRTHTHRTTGEARFVGNRIQNHPNHRRRRLRLPTWLRENFFAGDLEFGDNDDDDDDEDDDDFEDGDDYIDTESLGDWRSFRRSLALGETKDEGSSSGNSNINDDINSNNNSNKKETKPSILAEEREVTENEKVLREQNEKLAEEYAADRWAYETPTAEVGGLVLRMPLEVELHRNHKHSIIGSKLRALLVEEAEKDNISADDLLVNHWYEVARELVEEQMSKIADNADEEGQIDATTLPEDFSEMLTLYLDHQEQWQEVCLVLEKTDSDEGTTHSAKTLVLNRPMAFQLTNDLAKVVYLGAFSNTANSPPVPTKASIAETAKALTRFKIAFKEECAVYVGGPDHQGEPAILVHGIKHLPGATELSPGTGIYRGGIDAAVEGVLDGTYHPLDFRFFVGCHDYPESMLDVDVTLGKYQPIACSRVLALKQCISLPQPLWHEVMELCTRGDLPELSALELKKHDDVTFRVLEEDDLAGILGLGDDDDDDDDDDDEVDFDIEILDDDADDDTPWIW